MQRVPIIILNWNGIEDTIECLDSVFKLTYSNYQVYLVDNNSTDGSQEKLLELYQNHPKVKLIFNDKNLGFTKGNNRVLREILNHEEVPEYVVLLNNDTEVDEKWLTCLIQSAIENKVDMLSSKMIDYYDRDKMDNAGHLMLNTGEVIPIGHGLNIDGYNVGRENLGACAGAALYSSKMLQEIGIFDEHFSTGYEDAELGIRASLLGFKCYFEPKAIVYHKMGRSVKKIFNYDYSLSIQKHILYSYLKLMPLPVILIAIPSFAFKYASMFVIDVAFWRPKYLKIMYQSIKETLIDDYVIIQKARKKIYKNRNTISSLSFMKKQTFFLFFDINRFYKYFIKNRPSAFDTYGKVH